MTFSKLILSLLAAGVLSGAAQASTIFNFDNDNLGTSTNFTDTVNGLSATFSSPADPGGFVVYASMFETLTGNVLGDPGPAGLDNLAVLGPSGNFLGTFGTASTVDGPWAMAVYDMGSNGTGTAHVFLSNVLSGVISRFDITYTPTGLGATAIVLANGFNHRTDPAALVLGPSGLAYDAIHDILYVASSTDNAVYEIPTARTTQTTVAATLFFEDLTHLHGPLDVSILPNGHFLVADSDGSNANPNQPSELVEYTATGEFLAQMSVDPNNGGAFGLAINNMGWGTFRLAAVDDNANALNIWTAVAQ